MHLEIKAVKDFLRCRFRDLAVACAAAIFVTVSCISIFNRSTISFNDDIRPILNANCTGCHGGVKKAGGISFIYREEALGVGASGKPCIVPGNPEASELYKRLKHHDVEKRMPLGKAPLTDKQISLIKNWIAEGAHWEEHWAYVAPAEQKVPNVSDPWIKNEIDAFVLEKIKQSNTGLKVMPEADRYTLARRLSLDLVGIPLSYEATERFVNDKRPQAYEALIDSLLASPHYGEKWASMWLDLARYADTKGYEKDLARNIWRYRDYVIKSFNDNKPFDTFVQEQLAGDLMPGAGEEQILATAFHRNTLTNDEGGTDNEEFRTAAVIDRVNTTFDVFQGITMGCVQCHNHPYDPIPQKDYYRFMAFLNNTKDFDHFDDIPNYISKADTPTARIKELMAAIDDLQNVHIPNESYEAKKRRHLWPKVQAEHANASHKVAIDEIYAYVTAPGSYLKYSNINFSDVVSIKIRSSSTGGSIAKIYLDKPYGSPITTFELQENFGEWFEYGDNIKPVKGVHDMYIVFEKTKLGFCNSALDFMVFGLKDTYQAPSTYDASSFVTGSTDIIKFGKKICCWKPDNWITFYDIDLRNSNKIAFKYESSGGFAIEIRAGGANGTLLAKTDCKPTEEEFLKKVVSIPPYGNKTHVTLVFKENSKKNYQGMLEWIDFNYNPGYVLSKAQLARLDSIQKLKKELASYLGARGTPVMVELPPHAARVTRIFHRGNWLSKTDTVHPGTPQILNPFPKNAPNNRLGMAMWLTSNQNPLTARVAVNRFWEQLFGFGIVETLEDFGSQGSKPTHPELLDYLALKFMNEFHWDIKKLIKYLCMSATYRQSSVVTKAHLEKDPRNKLYARGPRVRLSAEQIRDQALAVSGLLSSKMYGPSVMPYQPDGLWQTVYNGATWETSPGEDRYRRMVYTYIRRSASYPNMLTFDGPTREFCMVRRIRTNTPLQALAMLNDTTYIEAAQKLAEKMARKKSVRMQIALGLQSALLRQPDTQTLNSLEKLYNKALEFYKGNGKNKVMYMTGKNEQTPENAALTVVANAMLNLDEFLTKE